MSYSPITKPEITSGTLVDNRYIIERLLGQGGLGRTYLAFDSRRFNEPCVLKEFAPVGTGLGGLEKCRDLFRREAKILHQLEHPQIPRFLACFEGDNRLFLVQEFVNGKTYSTLLAERQRQGLTFTENEVIEWLKNLLPVLEYVHQHNIIHRDISPDNIMLPDGKNIPVLIDFGVGKQIAGIGQTLQTERNTFVGKVSLVGKVGYAPREQISLGICSPSSDLYALGVTAVVLMTGKEPSSLMNQYSLEWQWHQYTNVSDAFARVLDRMLADTPKIRYQTAIETLASLENLGVENRGVNNLNNPSTLLQNPISGTPPTAFISHPDNSFAGAPKKSYLPENQSRNIYSTNRGFYSATPTNQEFNSQYQTNREFYPQNQTNQGFHSQNPTNREFRPEQGTGRISYLDANFIQCCQEKLAYHIGPMANLIVEDILIDNPNFSPQQFVELLANEIPDSQAAIEFVRNLLK
ncbi:MAG: serine/threonine-protein kinase [Mastigocoleus sp. MO_167.B18]|nr:serine/threonine-protein kinase [Mastigocoleus sp. MO_167.B18]